MLADAHKIGSQKWLPTLIEIAELALRSTRAFTPVNDTGFAQFGRNVISFRLCEADARGCPPISGHLHADARGYPPISENLHADARGCSFFALDARADARMLADAPDPSDALRMRKHPAPGPIG